MIFELPHTQYGYRSGEQVELSGSALKGGDWSRIAQPEHSVNKNERSFKCELIRSGTEHLFVRNFRSIQLNPCSDPRPPLNEVLRE